MRQRLPAVLLALLLFLLPAAAVAAEAPLAGALVILHTGDTDGRLDGYAKAAGMQRLYEALTKTLGKEQP